MVSRRTQRIARSAKSTLGRRRAIAGGDAGGQEGRDLPEVAVIELLQPRPQRRVRTRPQDERSRDGPPAVVEAHQAANERPERAVERPALPPVVVDPVGVRVHLGAQALLEAGEQGVLVREPRVEGADRQARPSDDLSDGRLVEALLLHDRFGRVEHAAIALAAAGLLRRPDGCGGAHRVSQTIIMIIISEEAGQERARPGLADRFPGAGAYSAASRGVRRAILRVPPIGGILAIFGKSDPTSDAPRESPSTTGPEAPRSSVRRRGSSGRSPATKTS